MNKRKQNIKNIFDTINVNAENSINIIGNILYDRKNNNATGWMGSDQNAHRKV